MVACTSGNYIDSLQIKSANCRFLTFASKVQSSGDEKQSHEMRISSWGRNRIEDQCRNTLFTASNLELTCNFS